MKKKYIVKINDFFDKRFKKYGEDVQSLGWSKKGQEERFKFFSKLTSLNNKTVLDVGSGFGDLAYYLNGFKEYVGYDINENFIKFSKPSKNISFELKNILLEPVHRKFDIVFSIGALNTKFDDNEKVMKEFIKKIFDSCNDMCAISMTSSYVQKGYKNSQIHYYNPSEIFSYAKTLAENVVLYHNYQPHDFTIVLYK